MEQEKLAWRSTAICTALLVIGIIMEVFFSFNQTIFYIGAILVGGFELTIEGVRELVQERHFNVDLLMVIAALAAGLIGDWREGALLIFIFSLSHIMEEYATRQSTREINRLLDKQPQVARKIDVDGSFVEMLVKDLVIGDHLAVFKGESIPTDAQIIRGTSEINEAVVSGESVPRLKSVNDEVYGGTVNLGNELEIIVTKDASETMLAQIIRLVKEAQNSQTTTESFLQKIENRYVLAILIGVPLMVVFFYFGLHWTLQESLYRGVNLLVVASPCALVASSTPALLSAISNGAKRGVLFKGGTYLEDLSEIKSIAFDKTGTLTRGELTVTNYDLTSEALIPMIVALESKSTHPIAIAIKEKWQVPILHLTTEEQTAQGMQTIYQGTSYYVGKKRANYADTPAINQWKAEGKTVVYVEKDAHYAGAIALLDTVNTNAKEAVTYFNQQGVHTVMLTGDAQNTADFIGSQVEVRQIEAALLPEDKVAHVREQKETFGKNAMVGDGINDAPALATATLGIAMGQGTDVAMEVSDVVIMENDLSKLVYTHRLSKKMKRVILQNICFSIFVIVTLIFFNIRQQLTIPFAVIGHEGSTILVVLNGLRLLLPVRDSH
ncbi:heavy metal translocating P-type ATPase [Candidatus Enterococcus willemsii]|uniref:Cadmium-translocating P-type ATPase n=1 Tax=Candidatus Enterococcus willemsii TaxID=1857215 RepID=A0ABQ6YWD6_9ENTE|nr:heavy metal translocating P-type ATPase [Enterococcus sp. CU12B]KAF1302002.1 cadmium-translocating P-type ATPase [Enterococcus sp. CU12B]